MSGPSSAGDLPVTKMYKPRSEKAGQNAFMAGLRAIGGASWNTRYVWTAKGEVLYGAKPGEPEKRIPFVSLTRCDACQMDEMKRHGCPEKYLECGWLLECDEKTTYWACESRDTRDQWVGFLKKIIVDYSPEGRAKERAPTTFDPTQETLTKFQDELQSEMASERGADEDYDDFADSPSRKTKTAKELRAMVGEEEMDDGFDEENMDEEFEEDSEDDIEQDEELIKDLLVSSNQANVRDEHEIYLYNIAKTPYVHTPQKIMEYAAQFKPGETDADIRFCRTINKIGKRDTSSPKDIVITTKTLYIFGKGSLISKMSVRSIGLEHVVGVIESTVENNLFAVLVPSFHDVLIRVVPQRSPVAGSEEDVKTQCIAHIFNSSRQINADLPFIFRQTENVRRFIRRSEDDKHLPLESTPRDKFKIAKDPNLFPALRTNADSTVFFSANMIRLTKKEKVNRVIALTDLAVYILTSSNVARRTGFTEIAACFYDLDERYILVKARPCDVLLQAKSDEECNLFINLLKDLYSRQLKRDLISKPKGEMTLLGLANLTANDNQQNMTAEGILKGMKLTQRLLRKAGRQVFFGSAAGVKNVLKVGEKGLDLGMELLSGVGNVGENLLDIAQQRNSVVFPWDIEEDSDIVVPEKVCDFLKIWDTGHLSLQQMGIKNLYYSSMGQKYHLRAVNLGTLIQENPRRTDKLFLINSDAFMIFDDPNDSRNIAAQVASAAMSLFTKRARFSLDNNILFKQLVGLCFCKREMNHFALLTTDEHSHDYLLRVPSLKQHKIMIAVLAREYYKHMGYHLQFSYIETAEELSNICRKTKFDTSPQLALETTENDVLQVFRQDQLIEKLRKYGDTKVYFSNVVERPKNAAMKSMLDGIENAAGVMKDAFTGLLDGKGKGKTADKKKSFKLIVTNCAVYTCATDWQVQRRVELKDIECICTEKDDPDSLLLSIPSEFDMIVCTPKSKVLMAALQDAHLVWTNHDIAEKLTRRSISEYRLALKPVPSIYTEGKFEKPKSYTDAAGTRTAEQCRANIHRWIAHRLIQAIKMKYDEDIERIDDPDNRGAGGASGDKMPSFTEESDLAATLNFKFEGSVVQHDHNAIDGVSVVAGRPVFQPSIRWQMQKWENVKQSIVLRTELRRARLFRYPENDDLCQSAKETLGECEDRLEMEKRLQECLLDENLEEYETLKDQAENLTLLDDLLEDMAPCFEYVRKKKTLIEDIRSEIEFNASVSEDALIRTDTPLVSLFERAIHMGVSEQELAGLRRKLDTRVQKEILLTHVAEQQQLGENYQLDVLKQRLMKKVSGTLSMQESGLKEQPLTEMTKNATKAYRGLSYALETGSLRKVEEALEVAKKITNPPAQLTRLIQSAEKEFKDGPTRERLFSALTTLCTSRYDPTDINVTKLAEMEKNAQQLIKESQEYKGLRTLVLRAGVRAERMRHDIALKQGMRRIEEQDEKVKAEIEKAKKLRADIRRDAAQMAKQRAEEEARKREQQMLANLYANATALVQTIQTYVKDRNSGQLRGSLTEVRMVFDQLPSFSFEKANPKIREMEEMLTQASALASHFLASTAKASHTQLYSEAEKYVMEGDKDRLLEHIQQNHSQWTCTELERIKAMWHAEMLRRTQTNNAEKQLELAQLGDVDVERLRTAIRFAAESGVARHKVSEAEALLLEVEATNKAASSSDLASAALMDNPSRTLHMDDVPTIMPRNPVIQELYRQLYDIISAPDAQLSCGDDGVVRAVVMTTHNMSKLHAEQWNHVFSHRLKPQGMFRKTERSSYDVFVEASKISNTVDGKVIYGAPNSAWVLKEFERIKKFNNPKGLSNNVMLMQFLLQTNSMNAVLHEICKMPTLLDSLYYPDALVSSKDLNADILKISSLVLTRVQFHYDITMGDDYLDSTLVVQGMANSSFGLTPQDTATKNLRMAVRRLNTSFMKALQKFQTESTAESNPNGKRVLLSTFLDESTNKKIGLVVRESLCTAIIGVMMVGFKEGTIVKTHLWQFLEASVQRLKESARDLGGIGFPVAMDVISSLVEKQRKAKGSGLSRKKDSEINDIRCRALICYALNNHQLQTFIDTLYDMSTTNVFFLKNYYQPINTLLLKPEFKAEVDKVLGPLSKFPFALSLDAELW